METVKYDEDTKTSDRGPRGERRESLGLGLVVVYADDPRRIGEVVFVPREGSAILGRGSSDEHLFPVRQRPGSTVPRQPFDSQFLSREQLRITRSSERSLHVQNVGKCALSDASGREVGQLDVRVGEAFALGRHLVLSCVERPRTLPALHAASAPDFGFGEVDADGVVGESPNAWALRDTLAFVAARSAHVLILGPSGSGKEIAAQAIHRLSARSGRPLVSRNASTLPSGLIEAELFGNVANYPSHGMPERPGLVGEAHGSTLFLDELGELSEELSTRLLRLLDDGGDYQRLGDARKRRADLRVVGATNRPVSKLRADVAARFKLRISLAGLDARREDIPLLVRHLMRKIASQDADIARRFLARGRTREPDLRIAPELLLRLVAHRYTAHVRELDALLWVALASSTGDIVALTPEVEAELALMPRSITDREHAKGPPSADEISAVLARVGGAKEKAWRELGLANRHVLKRLVKKYGLSR